jgi:LysM repeat protein
VLPGDTLSSLAKHYNCSEDDIKTWNGLQDQPLSKGQRLRVTPPDSTPSTETVYHMVEFSETLSAIAERYGHSPAELARWNNLKPPYKVEAGQKLRVAPPTPEQDSGDTTPVVLPDFHLVKPGESLRDIAKMYGVPLTDLAKWNGIRDPYPIFPGLELKLAPR